jgi:hypothetical protein
MGSANGVNRALRLMVGDDGEQPLPERGDFLDGFE